MSKKPHRPVSDSDWNQLITLASGYLSLEGGDVQAAMSRALAAHVQLISSLKAERISTVVADGRVTMFVPPEGGVALRLDPIGPADDGPTVSEADRRTPSKDVLRSSATYMMEEED